MIKSGCLLLTVFLIGYHSVRSQNLEWANTYGTGTYDYQFAHTGNFEGCNYSVGRTTVSGWDNCFVHKIDPYGNTLWTRTFGSPDDDYAHAVAMDSLENVYTVGRFQQTMDIDPTSGDCTVVCAGVYGGFIQKLSPSGDFIWAKNFGAPSARTEVSAVSIDDSGYLYIAGHYELTVDFNPGGLTPILSSSVNESSDLFIQKMNLNGEVIWTKFITGQYSEDIYSLRLDNTDNIYISGGSNGTVDFDPGIGVYNLDVDGPNDPGSFIVKLDNQGEFVWAKVLNGPGEFQILDACPDQSENVFATGRYEGTNVDFNPSSDTFLLSAYFTTIDMFILKLDSAGNFSWAKSIGNLSTVDAGHSLATDQNGNVFVCGQFGSTVDFDPGSATLDIPTNGGFDVFLQKYDSLGNHIWTQTFGNAQNDIGTAVSCSPTGNEILLSGAYYGTVDFQPGPLVENVPPIGGFGDVFTIKLNDCTASFNTQVIMACEEYTWINGLTYYNSNNTATITLSDIMGCDSIILLNLTITNADESATFLNPGIYSNAIGASYQWVDCDDNFSDIPFANEQIFIPDYAGNFAVVVTENGCTDTSTCFNVSSVLEIPEFFSQFQVYPNPFETNTTLYFGAETNGLYSVKVTNSSGMVLFSNEGFNENIIEFSADNLPSGIYFLFVTITESGEQIATRTLVKL